MKLIAFISIFLLYERKKVCKGEEFRIGVILDSVQSDETPAMQAAFSLVEQRNPSIKIHGEFIIIKGDDRNDTETQVCSLLFKGISFFLDISLTQGSKYLSTKNVVPMFIMEPLMFPFLNILSSYISSRSGGEVTIILENEKLTDATFYRIIRGYDHRVLALNMEDNFVNNIKNLRPVPSYFSAVATSEAVEEILKMIVENDLIFNAEKWSFVFFDTNHETVKFPETLLNSTKITLSESSICEFFEQSGTCNSPGNFELLFTNVIAKAISSIIASGTYSIKNIDCNNLPESEELSVTPKPFKNKMVSIDDNLITYNIEFTLSRVSNTKIGQWLVKEDNHTSEEKLEPARRFFRVGIAEAKPWTYLSNDPEPIWEGYCIDFIEKLAEKMNFDYTLVTPKNGKFGERSENGDWDGLVGDLVTGEIDLAVASLLMTAEREEVIDYVAPYFEQTGVSIVIRKPVPKTSLFKFMTVLRIEVWLSILASIVGTALLLWFLDRYSPYSSHNNKEAYPYETRDFSLNECVWFALTSFTPQGGGETPKAVSARILVAAYWLFVTLMLATFTANLAAFLTVERMQAPVQSLEQLGRQSRINYTVVEGSNTHKYFINMKFAEDTLYRLWKELTLNATNDQSQYRVWDYPIKEQYGHILLSINDSIPVKDAATGFQMVDDHENADFAFIHDAAEIKYEVTVNCNLTEIGEVFAEQPYAVAVQQGSSLQDEISLIILELQKERFFEGLTEKYWNSSLRADCGDGSDSEGITLESLGGVFIATLFGLGMSMVVLVFETLYYRRKAKKMKKFNVKETFGKSPPPSFKEAVKDVNRDLSAEGKEEKPQDILMGKKSFVPIRKRAGRVSYINVRPRRGLNTNNDPPYGINYFD